MITFLFAVIKLLIILCIVATIHEFGHFLAAKFFKIGVNEFSIGFGPKIVQKKKGGTMYSLRWIPLGGYVMIEGEGEASDREDSFAKKHPFKRIVVLMMGVIFNFILGFIILTIISFFVPVYTTEITDISDNSPLMEAGVNIGDKILKIDGKKVLFASDLTGLNYTGGDSVAIEYLQNGERKYTVVNNVKKSVGYAGIAFKTIDKVNTNIVNYTQSGSAAQSAGIKDDDVINSINGTLVKDASEIIAIVQENGGKSLSINLTRDGQSIDVNLVPEVQFRFDLGILDTKEEKSNIYYSLMKSLNTIKQVAGSYVELFKGKVGINDVSSIVGIGVVVSQTNGLLQYLNMMAIISLAVGAANILPFVPLDGGKIVFVIYEWITKKKPSEKFEIVTSYIGWGLLMLLTIVVTFKDIISIF